jgi:cyclase
VTILAREELRRRLRTPAGGAAPTGPAGLPMVTYAGPTIVRMNGEEVQLIPLSTAHTDGDTLVVFKNANVIMTGDLFRTLGYPIIDRPNGGTLPGLLKALDEIVRISDPATTMVPGHGEPANREAVVAYRDMIIAIRDRVGPMIARGMTVEEVIAAAPTSSYNSQVRGWDGQAPGFFTTADRFVSQLYEDSKVNSVASTGARAVGT